MLIKNLSEKINLSELSKEDLVLMVELYDQSAGFSLDFMSKDARNDIHEILLARFKGGSKRHVEYIISGENNKVLAKGNCMVTDDDDQFYNICKHADIDMDDMWHVETIEDA